MRARRDDGLTFMDGHVHPAQAFLLQSVHVLGEGVPGLLARLDEGLVEGVVGLPSGDAQGSASSPIPATANGTRAQVTFQILKHMRGYCNDRSNPMSDTQMIWMSAIHLFQGKCI